MGRARVAVVAMFRVLVVCIGNVCRSPLAERLLTEKLPSERFRVSSAGVGALTGSPMEPEVAAALARLGGSAEGFVARQLTSPLVTEADLVLTATAAIRSRVLEDSPGALRRTFTLRELAALVGSVAVADSATELVAAAARARSSTAGRDLDVADPYRRDLAVHTAVADQIDEATTQVAVALAAAGA